MQTVLVQGVDVLDESFWVPPTTQITELIQTTEPRQISESMCLRAKHNNSNWCHFCLRDIFVHKTSCERFVDKCIKKYNANKTKFFGSKNKDAHMLGSMLCLEETARVYLTTTDKELFDRFAPQIRVASGESKEFITGGIIQQYNEYIHGTELDALNGAYPFSHGTALDLDDWLMKNNIRCEHCSFLACPFHHDFGGFGSVQISGLGEGETTKTNNSESQHRRKTKYCCGWCVESINSDSVSENSTEADIEIFLDDISAHDDTERNEEYHIEVTLSDVKEDSEKSDDQPTGNLVDVSIDKLSINSSIESKTEPEVTTNKSPIIKTSKSSKNITINVKDDSTDNHNSYIDASDTGYATDDYEHDNYDDYDDDVRYGGL